MLLYRASKECKATLLNLAVHKFDPQGVTSIAMLAESHISIHTWPERGMAVCDVFTCGDTAEPQLAVEYMRDHLKATDMVSQEFVRPSHTEINDDGTGNGDRFSEYKSQEYRY